MNSPRRERDWLTSRKLAVCLLLMWSTLMLSACITTVESEHAVAPQPTPPPKPPPLIAYLYEGGLWTIEASGQNARLLVASPEGEAINAHVWSRDGSRS